MAVCIFEVFRIHADTASYMLLFRVTGELSSPPPQKLANLAKQDGAQLKAAPHETVKPGGLSLLQTLNPKS